MRLEINYGREHLDSEIPDHSLVGVVRQSGAPALTDPVAAVRDALEKPHGFPALYRALTPDDHVTIVVDDHLPCLPAILTPILEHLAQAHVAPEAVTLLCHASCADLPSVDELPQAFRQVHLETHEPSNRKHLSYLATTRLGRRLYLNRTAVDADQVVVLAGCGYDPLLGYSGSVGALYPALSDEATRKEMCGRLSLDPPGKSPWPVLREAEEAAWLLGAPFMVQVIEGAHQDILHVVGGLADTAQETHRLLDAHWRATSAERADTVLATVTGDPAHHTFETLAQALACAARVVKPQGRIILLTGARPELGPGAEIVRQAADPAQALAILRGQTPSDMAAAFLWASSVGQAKVYLLSGLRQESAEELFTIPLDHAGQVQRLLNGPGSYLILADAHKTMAVSAKKTA